MSAIPWSWERTALGLLLREPLRNGHSAKETNDPNGVRVLTLTAVTVGDFSEANTKLTSADRRRVSDLWLESGDLLIERSNTPELVGTTRLYRGPKHFAVYPDLIIRARLHHFLDSRYIELVLQSRELRHHFRSHAKGMAGSMPKIDQQTISEAPIPLPPLAEQKRIVAKIEELFSEIDAGEENLRRARRQLGVYRQSLLKQAFEGKLTAAWREEHPESIEEWAWKTLQDVAEVTGGLTKNSKRDALSLRIPYLRVANVYANELRLDEIKDIGVTPEEASKVRLLRGDLLIVEGNGSLDQIGRVARWDGSIQDCGHQNHLIRARCGALVTPSFILMFLLSPRGRALIENQAASTSGLHTLSVSKVQRLQVPVCSLPEQQEIVRLLDEQFSAIEQNEREIDAALKRSEALRQSILKRAFTGQLVPQDPADEPASVLLKRIRMTAATRSPRSAARGLSKQNQDSTA